ncbi:hypothetical protein [Haloferula sp. BvORR071]|uniref:hypothetical protein n=1 Tax=Haloferula sp. BvORR071 TaxID=1396141 RepID=UPI000553112C|nr:hypothetical protein [Haloferula sp. BvORR071]
MTFRTLSLSALLLISASLASAQETASEKREVVCAENALGFDALILREDQSDGAGVNKLPKGTKVWSLLFRHADSKDESRFRWEMPTLPVVIKLDDKTLALAYETTDENGRNVQLSISRSGDKKSKVVTYLVRCESMAVALREIAALMPTPTDEALEALRSQNHKPEPWVRSEGSYRGKR